MKKIFYSIAAFTLISVNAFALCEDSICEKPRDKFKYWEGIDIGLNGYMTPSNSLSVPSGSSFLELDYARSRSIAWNMGQLNIPIAKHYVQLVTGFGLEWNSYSFRNNWSLNPDAANVTATEENIDFSKNKLKTTWVNVPLLLEFNTGKNEDKSFHLAVGVTGGYNLFRNRLKQEFNDEGNSVKRKVKDDFNVNPFRYALTARMGIGHYSVFANYSLSEMFKGNRGPELYPFSAGFTLNF
jgi:hypothetical protein